MREKKQQKRQKPHKTKCPVPNYESLNHETQQELNFARDCPLKSVQVHQQNLQIN